MTKTITCECGTTFDYQASDVFGKPTWFAKSIQGNYDVPKDREDAVRCPKCKNDIFTGTKRDINGKFIN